MLRHQADTDTINSDFNHISSISCSALALGVKSYCDGLPAHCLPLLIVTSNLCRSRGIGGCNSEQSKGGLPHPLRSSIAQKNISYNCIFVRSWWNVKSKFGILGAVGYTAGYNFRGVAQLGSVHRSGR